MKRAIRTLAVSLSVVAACGGNVTVTGGAGGTGGACNPACGEGRTCCSGICANLENDPHNCGACGTLCSADELCTGECAAPPCTTTCSGESLCCGTSCCAQGELCCDPQGPVSTGPVCTPPDENGSCAPGCAPLCVCASPDTPIATPLGDRPIAELRPGDLVYTVDRLAVVALPLVRVNRTAVQHHRVVRLVLENGSILEISGRHPTADGRTFEALRAGDRLDGIRVESAEVVPYANPHTYDVLPDSDTGAYYAGGALIGSTLAP